MIAYAPGKIILSGEHAVVFGKPALATAVDQHVYATIEKNNLNKVAFICRDFSVNQSYDLNELKQLKETTQTRYQEFKKGNIPVGEILAQPFDVCLFAFILCLDKRFSALTSGATITLSTNIPVGCGMGASAAFINATIHATQKYFDLPLSDNDFLALALEAENCQHGHASGLDVHASYWGGCLHYQNHHVTPLKLTLPSFTLVYTGRPTSSTGECVSKVRENFSSSTIWDDFEKTTNQLFNSIKAKDNLTIRLAIKDNHRLLTEIGVVPNKVQQFIRDIENQQGAAKICGAGAISGEQAGILLVYGDIDLKTLCEKYQYTQLPFSGGGKGVHEI